MCLVNITKVFALSTNCSNNNAVCYRVAELDLKNPTPCIMKNSDSRNFFEVRLRLLETVS